MCFVTGSIAVWWILFIFFLFGRLSLASSASANDVCCCKSAKRFFTFYFVRVNVNMSHRCHCKVFLLYLVADFVVCTFCANLNERDDNFFFLIEFRFGK